MWVRSYFSLASFQIMNTCTTVFLMVFDLCFVWFWNLFIPWCQSAKPGVLDMLEWDVYNLRLWNKNNKNKQTRTVHMTFFISAPPPPRFWPWWRSVARNTSGGQGELCHVDDRRRRGLCCALHLTPHHQHGWNISLGRWGSIQHHHCISDKTQHGPSLITPFIHHSSLHKGG